MVLLKECLGHKVNSRLTVQCLNALLPLETSFCFPLLLAFFLSPPLFLPTFLLLKAGSIFLLLEDLILSLQIFVLELCMILGVLNQTEEMY